MFIIENFILKKFNTFTKEFTVLNDCFSLIIHIFSLKKNKKNFFFSSKIVNNSYFFKLKSLSKCLL
ncbi:hypothetical protein AMC76_00060 [Candidatus Carsonella ruddii]|nr:hypothetical protein AMC76_00060 [Candidatus Carsonella ruddii]